MRMLSFLLPLTLLALATDPSSVRADATNAPDGTQRPLSSAILALRDPGAAAKRTVRFIGRWTASKQQKVNPAAVDSVLRIKGTGDGDGDSGPIALDPTKWKVKGKKGFKYNDPKGTAGGIRTILLSYTPTGGSLKILGGQKNWAYAVAKPQSQISVLLSLGSSRWCAVFDGSFKKNVIKRVDAKSDKAPASCPCADDTRSTWEAIQKHIIAKHGCAVGGCHGAGGNTETSLDLTPAVAHASLVGKTSDADPSKQRVKIFAARDSMLWLKLAKSTLTEYGNVPKAGMPLGTAPLSKDELEVVRLWIQAGAPADGVVAGTGNLLQSCLPPPDPIKAEPVPPPAVTEGVQFYAPPWDIPARNNETGTNGEGEVCYATWYDFSDQVPDEFQAPCPDYWGGSARGCFLFNHPELTQDPNSHHSIIHIYRGEYRDDPSNPEAGFGPFKCAGGTNAGQECDPKGAANQCPGGGCAGIAPRSLACIGYGPKDLKSLYKFDGVTYGDNMPTVGGSQQPYLDEPYPPGVFGSMPIKGIMIWNSHAFNTSDRPTTNEQYFNVFFAPTADRIFPARSIFDDTYIFVQNVKPYERQEYCSTHTLPVGARVFQLSSHTHKRGVLFRSWEPPITPCTPGPGCQPETKEPNFVTTTYNDPTLFRYDTPRAFDDADVASRTYKFCAIYDNGAEDPTTVKRASASPQSLLGGKCKPDVMQCYVTSSNDPKKSTLCVGSDGKPDDHLCDSAPGANDGICDACPLRGGVTTEDEMFIYTGLGFCAAGTPCQTEGF